MNRSHDVNGRFWLIRRPPRRSPGPSCHTMPIRCQYGLLLLLCCLSATGCVRRRMTIRSNPPGAMVYVDDQQIGLTPVSTEFTYYGTRKIRLVKDQFETMTTYHTFAAPWYQLPPLDFVTENFWGRENPRRTGGAIQSCSATSRPECGIAFPSQWSAECLAGRLHGAGAGCRQPIVMPGRRFVAHKREAPSDARADARRLILAPGCLEMISATAFGRCRSTILSGTGGDRARL